MKPLEVKIKIKKLERSLIVDEYDIPTDCVWNEMVMEEIDKLKKQLKNEKQV